MRGKQDARRTLGRALAGWQNGHGFLVRLLALSLSLLLVGAGAALANASAQAIPPKLTSADLEQGVREGGSPEYHVQLTHPQAAEELPHRELDREQAINLMEAVFAPVLEAPAGMFDELEVERFLSRTAAILPAGEHLESAETIVGAPPSERYDGPTLIESTTPLRTEDGSGPSAAIDLSLEHAEGELQAANPLTEVGLPTNLGEGIDLPEVGVKIRLNGAPSERTPSLVDDSVAAYPEVARDTSLAVSPTATGLETMTVLQSADAPETQTFRLDLPKGASLRPTEAGGAEVLQEGRSILGVATPNALDAAGKQVPVSLTVSEDSLNLKVSPDSSTSWPVVVDPLYETYNWWNGITGPGGWGPWTTASPYYYTDTHDHCDPFASPYSCQTGETSNAPGLFIGALPGPVAEGASVHWEFVVPRWAEEWQQNNRAPTSYITSLIFQNIGFWQRSDWAADPTLWMGIWNSENPGWIAGRSASGNYPGMNGNGNWEGNAGQNTGGKVAAFSMVDPSGYDLTAFRDAFVNTAIISIADTKAPEAEWTEGPKKWLNQVPAEPINARFKDFGLGVYRLTAIPDGVSPAPNWPQKTNGCTGTTIYPCPGTTTFTLSRHGEGSNEARDYDPSVMPQGIDYVSLYAEDPLGNKSGAAKVRVKVDHTAPSLVLSGSMTEQALQGTKQPSYTLHLTATDGTEEHPQSGVAKTVVKLDGGIVDESDLGCTTKNCSISREWTLESGNYSAGQHTVEVIATDEVGLTRTKTLTIDLEPEPKLTLSGTMANEAAVGTTRPSYDLKVNAEGEAAGAFAGPLAEVSSFGSEGSGEGQLAHPGGAAIGSGGKLWVADTGNDRVEEFVEGSYLGEFGAPSEEEAWEEELGEDRRGNPGRLKEPAAVAVDPEGNLWVADAGNDRIEEFDPKGEYLGEFGERGSGEGQLNEPIAVAIGGEGNVWVADAGNDRIEKFGPEGEYLAQFETFGLRPNGFALDPEEGFWVTFPELGCLIKQGVEEQNQFIGGSCPGSQFAGIAIDSEGNPWVADTGDDSVVRFNRDGTKQLNEFGEEGSGEGQMVEPSAVAVGGEDVWAVDAGNNRIQDWRSEPVATVIAAEIAIDGEVVESSEALCTSDECVVSPEWTLDSSSYSAGDHEVTVKATDAAGNVGTRSLTIDLNHDTTPPSLSLSGSITEQASLGTERPSYALHLNASDGTEETPQSGVAKTVVKLDGGVVDEANPGCATQNCGISREWTLESENYSDGPHELEVIATDEVGLSTVKTLMIELSSAPTVLLSGTMTEQAKLGAERPRYGLQVSAEGEPAGAFGGPLNEVSTFGSEGSSEGQLTHPGGIAIDSEGNLWVADTGNDRVEEFDAEGNYLSELGGPSEEEAWEEEWGEDRSTNPGRLKKPAAVAIDSEGNLWVADTGNDRVEEFNPEGEYLGEFGEEGSGEGQLLEPIAVAIGGEGNIWVADAGNKRIEKFGSYGKYLAAQFETFGLRPNGFALDPEEGFWVTFPEYGCLIKQGVEEQNQILGGSCPGGQFAGIAIDPEGNPWVADPSNGSIKQFDREGATQLNVFGEEGSGESQLLEPSAVAVGEEGAIWVADTGNDRIAQWAAESSSSSITTKVAIDGTAVRSAEAGCTSEGCSVASEWTLESSAYSVGKHSVTVETTDPAGNSATKTLKVELLPDTTKPQIELNGALADAPEGWVEQRSYGFNASASDAGTGVSSLSFKIDGEQIASVNGEACPEGGCEQSLAKSVEMSEYPGGVHSAELVATDHAGNVATKQWAINVDPAGQVSSAEAIDTLEAVDDTSESGVVATPEELLDPEQIEAGDNPGLQIEGATVESTGVPDTTTTSTDISEGVTITSPEGETTFVPVIAEGSSEIELAEETAGISSNTGEEADTIIRPEYNGMQAFQAIRSPEAPEDYSWEVKLSEEQTLVSFDASTAEVVYDDGVVSFLITAEEAHDATGRAVPTSLSVEGNILTLHVEHRGGGFVYPVTAGQSFETGYETSVFWETPSGEEEEEGPPPPESGYFSESDARRVITSRPAGGEIIPAPEPASGGGASVSSTPEKVVKPYEVCSGFGGCKIWHVELKNPSYHYKRNQNSRLTAFWQAGTQVHSDWWYPAYYWPELKDEGWGCGFTGPNQVWSGEHKHLTIWGRYKIIATAFLYTGDVFDFTNRLSLQIWVWPNGFQQRREAHWDETPEALEAAQGCH